jgi:hypothetical protein
MATVPKPVTLTQRAAVAGELIPEPLVIVGTPAISGPVGTNVVESGRVTLVAGVKVVTTANALTASNILLSVQSLGTVTTPKAIAVTARSNGVSFTITSADLTETSVVAYQILA